MVFCSFFFSCCEEERRLDIDEKPLVVQLNWNKDDREGRFVLKNENDAIPAKVRAGDFADAVPGLPLTGGSRGLFASLILSLNCTFTFLLESTVKSSPASYSISRNNSKYYSLLFKGLRKLLSLRDFMIKESASGFFPPKL